MSIEQTITAHTDALKANTEAIEKLLGVWTQLAKRGNEVDTAVQTAKANGTAYSVTVAGAATDLGTKGNAPSPAHTPAAPATQTEAAAAEPAAESPSEEPATLELLTKETTALATRNRPALIALLGEYGVQRASNIPEAQWAEYIAKVRAL